MLLHIVARGRIGRGAEAELVERYVKRIRWNMKLTELTYKEKCIVIIYCFFACYHKCLMEPLRDF